MQRNVVSQQISSDEPLEIKILTYPISRPQQIALIDLLQHEWQRTNVDWLESMGGKHADHLVRHALIAKFQGEESATASVCYPLHDPEVCVIEDVMTLPAVRGRGIAAHLTTRALELAFKAGCKVAYLGNAPTTRPSVYNKCGFVRTHGAVMRSSATGHEDCESEFFAREQSVSVRATNWGDLPGLACLMDQELQTTLLNFRHGLVSPKFAAPTRCVSNFTSVWYDQKAQGGLMVSLIGAKPYRVLGFGCLVPGPAPAMNHCANLEIAFHDHYEKDADQLIVALEKEARSRRLTKLLAHAAIRDKSKWARLLEQGFKQTGLLQDHLVGNDTAIDVGILEKKL